MFYMTEKNQYDAKNTCTHKSIKNLQTKSNPTFICYSSYENHSEMYVTVLFSVVYHYVSIRFSKSIFDKQFEKGAN